MAERYGSGARELSLVGPVECNSAKAMLPLGSIKGVLFDIDGRGSSGVDDSESRVHCAYAVSVPTRLPRRSRTHCLFAASPIAALRFATAIAPRRHPPCRKGSRAAGCPSFAQERCQTQIRCISGCSARCLWRKDSTMEYRLTNHSSG
jgi:hypothetical protein